VTGNYLSRNMEHIKTVHDLFTGISKACDIGDKHTTTFPLNFGVFMKLPRLIETCLNKIYSKVYICKHYCDAFPFYSCLKQGIFLSLFLQDIPLDRSQQIRRD